MYTLSAGAIVCIGFLNTSFIVSQVGTQFAKFGTSNGTFTKVLLVRKSHCLVRLPSGRELLLNPSVYGVIGRNSGVHSASQVFGKASTPRPRGVRIIVRSTAKNPVDHPNGGRTRGKTLYKTP